MRIVIVDDEPVARRGLRQLLLRHPDAAVVGEARNGPEAVRVLSTTSPDVVLLDVQMPGCDGFEILRRIGPPLPEVIFISAYDDFAIKAFEAHALDYLLKPVHEGRFDAAIERARERIRSAAALEQAERLSRLLELQNPPASRLMIPAANGDLVLPVADVSWIEADDYYAVVHAHGWRHLLRESLDSLERRLDPHVFVRVHRSAIVNLSYVREWRRGAIILTDGHEVQVSRRRRPVVADAIRKFAGG